MSIFSETVTKAIGDYRFLLRRYLSQADRVTKLRDLRLKDARVHKDDLVLYDIAHAIVDDVEKNMAVPNKGYYSYSGLQQFAQYLKEYLDHYELEGDKVVHCAQKASRALIQSIQLTSLPAERLNDSLAKQLSVCNETVVAFGSQEQCNLQMQTLERAQADNPHFYATIITELESLVANKFSDAA